jgi:tetratricopeptide (TPR) repeat protein
MALTDFPALLHRIEQDAATPEDLDALEQLAEVAPGHVTAHVALAHACEQQGRRAEARRSWRHAHLLAPSSPAVRAGLRRTADGSSAAAGATEEESFVWKRASADAGPEEAAPTAASDAAPARSSGAELTDAMPPALEGIEAEGLAASGSDDLDGLIEEIERARIEPTPDPDDVPAPDLELGDSDMVSPTLARIYEAQGQHAEAARVYRRLAAERPAEADAFHQQADTLDAQARDQAHDYGGGEEGGEEGDNDGGNETRGGHRETDG